MSGAGLPLELPAIAADADVLLAPVVSSPRAAGLIARAWQKRGRLPDFVLVEGSEARITSPTGAFAPFTVHYAQTFILPEAAGAYRLESPDGQTVRAILARVRG